MNRNLSSVSAVFRDYNKQEFGFSQDVSLTDMTVLNSIQIFLNFYYIENEEKKISYVFFQKVSIGTYLP